MLEETNTVTTVDVQRHLYKKSERSIIPNLRCQDLAEMMDKSLVLEKSLALEKSQQKCKYNWEIDSLMLGQGSIGKVYKARDINSSKLYALKFVRFKTATDQPFLSLQQEIGMMKKLK